MASQLVDYCTYADAARPDDFDTLLRRAVYLLPDDEALIRTIAQGASRRDAAQLMGLAPGTVSRRLHRLITRLRDPLVATLIDNPGDLPPENQQLGIDHYLLKRPLKELAKLHHRSRLEIRETLFELKGWHKGRQPQIPRPARRTKQTQTTLPPGTKN